jgi:hypothetical protein
VRAGEGGAEPVFAGVLRQRLALKAAAGCARFARLREDEGALRDAEQLAPPGAPPAPASRPHRLFRLFSMRRRGLTPKRFASPPRSWNCGARRRPSTGSPPPPARAALPSRFSPRPRPSTPNSYRSGSPI